MPPTLAAIAATVIPASLSGHAALLIRGFQYCEFLLDQAHVADVLARAVLTLAWCERSHWLSTSPSTISP